MANQEVTFTVKFPQNAPPVLNQAALKLLTKRQEEEPSKRILNDVPKPSAQPRRNNNPRQIPEIEPPVLPIRRNMRDSPMHEPQDIRRPPLVQSNRMLDQRFTKQNGFSESGGSRQVPLRNGRAAQDLGPRGGYRPIREPPMYAQDDLHHGYLSDGHAPIRRPMGRIPIKNLPSDYERQQVTRSRMQTDMTRRQQEQRQAAVARSRGRPFPRAPVQEPFPSEVIDVLPARGRGITERFGGKGQGRARLPVADLDMMDYDMEESVPVRRPMHVVHRANDMAPMPRSASVPRQTGRRPRRAASMPRQPMNRGGYR